MYWYFTAVEVLALAFVLVMVRHMIRRSQFLLHMFQQNGYKFNEYLQWAAKNWRTYIVEPKHLYFFGVLLILQFLLSDRITGSAATIIIGLYGIFWFFSTPYYNEDRQKKPLVFTPRAIRLTIPFVILALVIPVFSYLAALQDEMIQYDIYVLGVGMLAGDLLLPLFVLIAGGLTWPIEQLIHNKFKRMARRKLESMPNLKVIAITGSYGKTTTKFLIRDLLKERFRVCATPASYNTPMGICKVINNDLEAGHQMLVLEMGARYEGNIQELCDIAQPDIAVVTTVGVAHLETFGSVQTIAKEKGTLVENVKPGGQAVLNVDNPYVQKMTDRTDLEYIKVGLDTGEISASNIQYDEHGCRFIISDKSREDIEKEEIHMPLLGTHNVANMLLAFGVGKALGLRFKTMAVAAQSVDPIEHRLELKRQNGLIVVDDAFNSNPVGAKNAIDTISKFDGRRKIVITPGMIELGDIQEKENRRFGEHMGRAKLDLIILVGREQTKPIYEGLQKTGFPEENIRVVSSLFKANDVMQDFTQEGDLVLYENDLPDSFNE